MAKLNCFDKVFGLLQLLSEKQNQWISTKDLQKFYNEKFDVDYSLRTAQNDMSKLKVVDTFLPNLFDIDEESGNKIKIKKPNFVIKKILSQYEHAFIASVIRRMVDYSSLDEKMLGFIDNYYDKFYVFNTIGFETAKFDIDNELIADLTYAIKKTKKINFTYARYGNVRQYKNFSPFRIIVTEDSWYLYGELEDDENKEIAYRVFVLNYISDIEMINKSFKIPNDIDFIVSRAKTIWFIVRKERVKITAELKPPVSTKVLELKDSFHYFTNQKIIEQRDDGTVLIEFYTVDDNYKQADFKNQVYHWFPDIKIISPKKFVDLIKSDMEKIFSDMK